MKTATWTCSLVITSALLLLATGSCTDREPTSAMDRTADDDPSLHQTSFRQDVCGVISTTLVITENTRLTCDVVCQNETGPCIQFGNHRITLWLNGFKMTGPASPPASNCVASPAFSPGNPGPFPFDGISTAGFDRVKIHGPGMVQTFRRHGIFVFESEKVTVSRVTSHHNCFSGILLGFANNNDLTDNVSVRNGSASGAAPCGGNCITNSNGNHIRRNHFYGNGSVAPGAPLGTPNDFGVGLVGTSSDNVIADNTIGGNINGILLFPSTSGNLIRRNVVAGNPPIQVAVTAGSTVGVDIRDASPAGANVFRENLCITYEGATTPPPCPNFSRGRGDQNDDR